MNQEHEHWVVLIKRKIEEGKITLPTQHEKS